MKIEKKSILNYSQKELESIIRNYGFERYRAKQLINQLLICRKDSFKDMQVIPDILKELLDEDYIISPLEISKINKSTDGSVKLLFKLKDEFAIESVFMPKYDRETGELRRTTICISTMSGCPIRCSFCATGTLEHWRNLDSAEIISQVLLTEKEMNQKITNIVIMGMGEPLLNFDNVVKALDVFTNNDVLNFSRKKVTLSTIGIPDKIYELSNIHYPIKLSLSLHATTDTTRNKLIPIANNYNINSILFALEDYYHKTEIPITFEYILFEDVNDTIDDASRLIDFTRRFPSKVNIIQFNDISFVKDIELKPSSSERKENFIQYLKDNEVTVIERISFGKEIAAACGQLVLSN